MINDEMVRSYCLIRFGSTPDPKVGLMVGFLAIEPIERMITTNGVIITPFKSAFDMEYCKESIAKTGHNFILVDVTEQSDKVSFFGDNAFMNSLGSKVLLTPDERERELFEKMRLYGNDVLTQDDHEFLKNRMYDTK